MQKIIIRTLALATIGSAAILGGSGSVSARESTAQSSFVELKASGAKFTYVRDGRRHSGLRGHHAGRPRAFGGRRFGHPGRGYGRGYGYRRGLWLWPGDTAIGAAVPPLAAWLPVR